MDDFRPIDPRPRETPEGTCLRYGRVRQTMADNTSNRTALNDIAKYLSMVELFEAIDSYVTTYIVRQHRRGAPRPAPVPATEVRP